MEKEALKCRYKHPRIACKGSATHCTSFSDNWWWLQEGFCCFAGFTDVLNPDRVSVACGPRRKSSTCQGAVTTSDGHAPAVQPGRWN
jgi:hypothetical protein